ncbi:uncharacterized protein LOC126975352 isoform X1 [Leptidea sinapis]|uniref:uncharacterized protein LOC126975352 isoform X1 n=1 Tax=Leptidea sinapis TaxID=189913 RepID=UPI00211FE463|nr:uncharacterized protein LOC126975352 isoform X1 [Leptidea sinapis]
MASSDPEIRDGFTLPVWMKSKPTKDFAPFSTSPPAPEDPFFYIRYPKTDVLFGNAKTANEVPNPVQQNKELGAAFPGYKEKDWSKHTKPCQDVLHSIAPINTAANPMNLKPKPAGTDDGFKGEGAACGNSVVKVASEMVSGRSRGFTVASPAEDHEVPGQRYLASRRGSKSLPTTPIHSPPSSPSGRRKHYNRYFTSPFEPVDDTNNRSWLTMALLGFKKDLTTSTSTLAEEEYVENRLQSGSLAESVENLGPAPRPNTNLVVNEMQTQKPKPPKPVRAKPSELREMNFWSPTSM